ncbi:MAG: hypothetical protein ACYCOX_02805, partial [Acidobacteriaceae bacterium]
AITVKQKLRPTSQRNSGPHHTGISGPHPMESPAHIDRNTHSRRPEFAHLKENPESNDDVTQLPYCVLAFQSGDSVFAAFDEFSQYAYQSEVDETLLERPLSVKRPKDFPRAIQALDSYLAFLRSLSTLHGVLENSPSEPTP